MSNWRPSIMEEAQLEDFVAKGLLPPRVVVHLRAPPTQHEEPRALSAKADPVLVPVGAFDLQKRARRLGDYPAYSPADSNWWWHEEWF
ncbi:hypothetical protein C2845_PM16G03720 [Panicum miliaceum]|uniref:Uncharacterized protein n=1 Tax=Panicum miliaceum TaxID=4540 RepID=A0A3L6PUR1_PANMI|nr:hypothetical protein C2845_PM16G03720 [Panicum miliaceum]